MLVSMNAQRLYEVVHYFAKNKNKSILVIDISDWMALDDTSARRNVRWHSTSGRILRRGLFCVVNTAEPTGGAGLTQSFRPFRRAWAKKTRKGEKEKVREKRENMAEGGRMRNKGCGMGDGTKT